ncbi:MAG: hypothetical protein OHK0024_31520 [Thalassobaculales bacterium]
MLAAGEPPRPIPAPGRIDGAALPAGDRLDDWRLTPSAPDWATGIAAAWQPGEAGAQARLAAFLDAGLDGYAAARNRPDLDATSRLSPHLHFGEVGPRQVWHAVMAREAAAGRPAPGPGAAAFLRELGWREFSHHLLHHAPDLAERPLRAAFAAFPWQPDQALLRAWKRGLTGYPIVDAGMRALWQTGWMHNRVRMVAASFLVKHLLLPWQAGEAWFWDTLVDAGLAQNAASWQWVAGCGADAAPYFRIFNPVLQGEKFDPEGRYVRRHLPEIAGLPDAYIHKPWAAPESVLRDAGVRLGVTYPAPVIAHDAARSRALEAFRSLQAA